MSRRGCHYTREEIAHIIARYPHATTRTIAAEIGRTRHSVRYMVKKMVLKRTAKQTSAIYRTWKRGPVVRHGEAMARQIEAEVYDLEALKRERYQDVPTSLPATFPVSPPLAPDQPGRNSLGRYHPRHGRQYTELVRAIPALSVRPASGAHRAAHPQPPPAAPGPRLPSPRLAGHSQAGSLR